MNNISYTLFTCIITVPPSITSPPTNVTIVLGKSVNFTCTATAHPLPAIIWLSLDDINGTRTQINATNRRYSVHNTNIEDRELVSTLTILEVELSNAGVYVCNAELGPQFPSVEESAILTIGET